MSTEKQRAALQLGGRIRQLACMYSMANNYITDFHNAATVRAIADHEMHKLGYESFTDHANRLHLWWDDKDNIGKEFPKNFHKYKRLT